MAWESVEDLGFRACGLELQASRLDVAAKSCSAGISLRACENFEIQRYGKSTYRFYGSET